MMDAKLAALGLGWITSTIGIIFWVLVIGLLFVIVRFIRRKDYLLAAVTCVPLAALFVLPVMSYIKQREYLAKYEPAKAIFDKLCREQSAPIIKRTVEDVEGVLLLKVRPLSEHRLRYVNDPHWPEAAWPDFGRLSSGKSQGYVEDLMLDWTWRRFDPDPRETPQHWQGILSVGGQTWEDPNAQAGETRAKKAISGFKYVDVLGNDGVGRTRFTARNDKEKTDSPYRGVAFNSIPTNEPAPRYGVIFEDNLDPDLRKHWIAGMTIKVIDTNSKEVIGQRTFWILDTGFGATGQFGPWSTNAKRCPRLSDPMGLIYSTLKTNSRK